MKFLIIRFSRSLGVRVGHIFVHITNASWSFGLNSACFLVIVLFIKGTSVFMFPLTASTSHVRWCLMRMFFLFPHSRSPPPLSLHVRNLLYIFLVNLLML